MGLLDEAIREHLELKRRRGADPTEVERLEREALGPVRRIHQDSVPDDEPALAGDVADPGLAVDEAEDQFEFEQEDELAPEPEVLASEPEHDYEPEHDLHEPEDPDQTRVMAAPDAPETHGVVPPPVPPPAEEPPSQPAPSERPVHEDPGVETAEYDVEAEHAEENDVLEETPEFLQDAPDHDRLWFEQRPPKDFDFDG